MPASIADLTPEQVAALRRFRDYHGREWKSLLNLLWSGGSPTHRSGDAALLRQVRNSHGPRWLKDLPSKALDN